MKALKTHGELIAEQYCSDCGVIAQALGSDAFGLGSDGGVMVNALKNLDFDG